MELLRTIRSAGFIMARSVCSNSKVGSYVLDYGFIICVHDFEWLDMSFISAVGGFPFFLCWISAERGVGSSSFDVENVARPGREYCVAVGRSFSSCEVNEKFYMVLCV